MIKLFAIRSNIKENIHALREHVFVNEGEFWYVHLGVNIGFEEDGKGKDFKRPVLIVKKIGNLFFVVPMTTHGKDDNKYYFRLDDTYFDKKSRIILSQSRMIDKKRCIEKIGEVSMLDFQLIKEKLRALLGF